jgi:hypothetical protein
MGTLGRESREIAVDYRRYPPFQPLAGLERLKLSAGRFFSIYLRKASATLLTMTKTEPHKLVDALPDESLLAVAILLRRAQDPLWPSWTPPLTTTRS